MFPADSDDSSNSNSETLWWVIKYHWGPEVYMRKFHELGGDEGTLRNMLLYGSNGKSDLALEVPFSANFPSHR